MALIERFEQFYRTVSADSVAQLDAIYHSQAVLVDPIATHRGLAEIKGYFATLLENTQACQCDIQHIAQQDQAFFVTWVMTIRHPQLNGGALFSVDGVSHLRSEQDKIIYHRDYYDLGEMVYEQVPLLKHLIKSIKKRMA